MALVKGTGRKSPFYGQHSLVIPFPVSDAYLRNGPSLPRLHCYDYEMHQIISSLETFLTANIKIPFMTPPKKNDAS